LLLSLVAGSSRVAIVCDNHSHTQPPPHAAATPRLRWRRLPQTTSKTRVAVCGGVWAMATLLMLRVAHAALSLCRADVQETERLSTEPGAVAVAPAYVLLAARLHSRRPCRAAAAAAWCTSRSIILWCCRAPCGAAMCLRARGALRVAGAASASWRCRVAPTAASRGRSHAVPLCVVVTR
jgi:hypothetical protein